MVRQSRQVVRAAVTVIPLVVCAVLCASASAADSIKLGATPFSSPSTTFIPTATGFGFESMSGSLNNANGTRDTQAGSHPYELTVSWELNENSENFPFGGAIRDFAVQLPPGLIGDPNATPQCTREQLDQGSGTGCPPGSEIGVDVLGLATGTHRNRLELTLPVFNMVPPAGVPAELGFDIFSIDTLIDSNVRSGNDYGITANVHNIPERFILSNTTTIWGVPSNGGPADPHNPPDGAIPFLTLPTSCGDPLKFTLGADSWAEPNAKATGSYTLPALTGCERLSFNPAITVTPDTAAADTPAGLTVDVKVPQEGLILPNSLSASDIKNTKVTLPVGVAINPGQAAGLGACQESEAHVHIEGSPPSCPADSKVGTDEISTPLLKDKLEGDVYVLQSNPPNLQLLIAAYADGVEVKLVADVHLDEATGQLTTTLTETPEVPFTDFKLSFSGGAQAALVTPPTCGSYTTNTDFTPWSTPFVGDVLSEDGFGIDTGPGGSACASPLRLPFSPSMIAGSTTDQAGAFTNFSLLLQRGDGQQRIEKLQFKEPAGLAGLISSVPLCDEANANAGTCAASSHIGHAVVTSGPGPYPLVLPQPGAPELPIYLTGPYKGAPFGLSIVTPVIAGPFNLGTIITRAKIEVDPLTAQITITTDVLPQIVDGVPTDLRSINSIIDRPNFLFNPTNCTPAEFTGTATSAGGAATAPLSSRFGVGSCRELAFKPQFKVSTSGKTFRKNGASLHVKLVYPKAPFGSQANISNVKVNLPKQLPSRLTTLQKACPAKTFEANPAGCPSASIVGHAIAITPILPVPLTGPAYFVSHGGEEFPSLIVVLQGYGVTVDLVGSTFIGKGITSSTFKTVPDVPVGTFELTLPQGKFSALAANGNLCKSKLKMPTAFVAQNGAVIHQSTPISVTGCPKKKAKAKAKKK
jgi:hypothetical protein